ncbi:MAG: hypothetical protein ACI9XJ_000213 [Marivirga sp.]|jgi:hypothetical protein
MVKYYLSFLLLLIAGIAVGQKVQLVGKVMTKNDQLAIGEVLVQVENYTLNSVSNSEGIFNLEFPGTGSYNLLISHVSFLNEQLTIEGPFTDTLRIYLAEERLYLKTVDVKADKTDRLTEVNLQKLTPVSVNEMATPFNEFSQLLNTLPGVVSNNELSSSYTVRGGNFDENLIYVNGIEIYRPFLVRAGQQEGLSFINPDLVSSVNFSAGGWESKYGDKLSSNLLVEYKEIDTLEGNINIGLLGASAYVGTKVGKRGNLIAGIRYKNARYLFNTFETNGNYLPRFVDFQAYYKLKLNNRTSIDILAASAFNDYLVYPATTETDFGNFQQKLRFLVVYDGAESLSYRTGQVGVRLKHLFSTQFKSAITVSAFNTAEYEYNNTEGFYRLCDVDRDINSDTFDECISQRGVGSDFRYARNILTASVIQLVNRNDYQVNAKNLLSFGVSIKSQSISDLINEYSFIDSSDFVTVNNVVNRENKLTAEFVDTYVQHEMEVNNRTFINYGLRLSYGSNTEEWLLSPRFTINRSVFSDLSGQLSFSAGIYRQYPFYRELRDVSGQLNSDVKSQNALHLVTSYTKDFSLRQRPFTFTTSAYYKHYFHLIPYDVENVRIRYRPELSATGYATGVDFRFSGEFIPDMESWFSLGLLSTKEDVVGDGRGLIRRPSDQRITASIFFQDHFINDPSLKVSLKLQIGSGLPFGPPNSLKGRNIFTGEWYRRMDVGFSKEFEIEWQHLKGVESFWLGIDVLNVLGVSNTISYSWVEDVNGQNFAVPNSLSARFLNLKGILKF